MKIGLIVLGVLVLLVLLVGGQMVGVRNDLTMQKNAIDGAFAQMDVVLQRRADLIPNIVETVKGFATQEKDVIASVANARAALGGARTAPEKIAANNQLDGALSRLLVVVENYPQLKSDATFMRLQDELAGTENRIAVERRKYNEAVQKYNTSIELFPNNIAASLFGFQRNDAYFKTDPASRQAPKVDFNKKIGFLPVALPRPESALI
jgi:LemA protein